MKTRQGKDKDASRPNLFSHPHDEDFTRPISVLSTLDTPTKGKKQRSRHSNAILYICTAVCILVLVVFFWQWISTDTTTIPSYAQHSPFVRAGGSGSENILSQEPSRNTSAPQQSGLHQEEKMANPFDSLTSSSAPAAQSSHQNKSHSSRKTHSGRRKADTDAILLEAILSPHKHEHKKMRNSALKSD